MNNEFKDKILSYERLPVEPEKMTAEEIRAELKARLDSELEMYISESLRIKRLAESSNNL